MLIKQIESSQGEAFSLDATLSDIKVIMSKLNLVSSPSIDQATSLAVAINTTIIPEEEVSAVVENVNDARGIAQKLYSGAVDARFLVYHCTQIIIYFLRTLDLV